jgi:hypothetical protein
MIISCVLEELYLSCKEFFGKYKKTEDIDTDALKEFYNTRYTENKVYNKKREYKAFN